MKNLKTRVTLPTYDDVKNLPLPVTDYARYTGVTCNKSLPGKEFLFTPTSADNRFNIGECWLATTGHNDGEVQTYTWKDFNQAAYRLHSHKATKKNIGVAPLFAAADKIGFSAEVYDHKRCLMLDGHPVFYPQNAVDPKTSAHLTNVYNNLGNNEEIMRLIGCYNRPQDYDFKAQKYITKQDFCYNYQGKNYVLATKHNQPDAWFHCEPIQVESLSDNKIIAKQTLFAAALENSADFFVENFMIGENQPLNMNMYGLGKYLNNRFLDDLYDSINFAKYLQTDKLQTLNADFNKNSLRSRVIDCVNTTEKGAN